MSKTCYLILSPSEWKDNAVSNMQIASELSKKNLVLYIETPGRRFPKLKEYKRLISRLRRIFFPSKDNIQGLDPLNTIIYSPLAIPNHNYKIFRRINSILLNYQINKLLKQHRFEDIYVWCFSPYWVDVVKKLSFKKLIFHCVDALKTYDTSNVFNKNLNFLISNADIVFTPNVLIYEELLEKTKKIVKVGHGVSKDNLLGPIDNNYIKKFNTGAFNLNQITYAGSLANWVDYNLLIALAREFTYTRIVLIGYIHALTNREYIKEMDKYKNIYFEGYKNYSDLPKYYANTDLAIIPYQSDNAHIQYSTPTKFLDYFAFGLPVISTNFPAAQEVKDHIEIASSHEDFIDKVATIRQSPMLSIESISNRIDFAKNNTWDLQVKKMLKEI